MSIDLLNITNAEWQKAEDFFNHPDNANKTKMEKKKGSKTEHSFIKIFSHHLQQFHIFAMANHHCIREEKYARLGKGSFSKVKVVQNRKGENFAVKIEGRGLRGEEDVETKITTLLGFSIGEAERIFNPYTTHFKYYKGAMTDRKLYTVIKLKAGEKLVNFLYLPNVKKKHTIISINGFAKIYHSLEML